MIKGKVILVPFPFDDLSATKIRPAMCLTNPIGAHRHVVLAFITSQIITPPASSDLVLDIRDPDFAATGLRAPSTVRLHRLMTVTTAVIRRELGELSPRLQMEVNAKLRNLFGL